MSELLQTRPLILAIDDTPMNLLVLTNALAGEFNVQTASSGAQGLEMAKVEVPSLILLDIMMPGIDGYDTCRRFKADPLLAQIPIIFVTALTESESEVKGLELGAADYLCKPINMKIARQRIRNLLVREALRQELTWHRDGLEELVASRAVELVKAREIAETANLAKSRFLANMSYEFRTPLAIMMGTNHLIKQRLSDEGLKAKCDMVTTAGTQLKGMFDAVLDASMMESQPVQQPLAVFSPEALLQLVIERYKLKAKLMGLSLVQQIEPELPQVMLGAPQQLKQVLEQFVSNAIKFSKQGSITLRASRSAAADASQAVRFEVVDHGIGIQQASLQKLFQLFSQTDDSMTREHEGLGLGLFLCSRLAKSMDGEIGVSSVPGEGSTFWIQISLAGQGQAQAPTALFHNSGSTLKPGAQ